MDCVSTSGSDSSPCTTTTPARLFSPPGTGDPIRAIYLYVPGDEKQRLTYSLGSTLVESLPENLFWHETLSFKESVNTIRPPPLRPFTHRTSSPGLTVNSAGVIDSPMRIS